MSWSKIVLILCCLFTLNLWASTNLRNPSTTPASAPKLSSVSVTKSFADWKNEKTRFAKEALAKAKASSTAEAQNDVAQLEFNLEVAEALSVTDYLVLYLSLQPGEAKYKEAATQLTPEETAKIMEAYLKAMRAEQASEQESPRRSSAIDPLN